MDPFTMLLLGSTGLGLLQGAQAAQRRKEDNAFRRESIRYSPWTGMGDPGASTETGNALTGGIQGALTGAQLGKGLGVKGGENWFQPQNKSNLAEVVKGSEMDAAASQAQLNKDVSEIARAQQQKMGQGPYSMLQQQSTVGEPTDDQIQQMINQDVGNEDFLENEWQKTYKKRGRMGL